MIEAESKNSSGEGEIPLSKRLREAATAATVLRVEANLLFRRKWSENGLSADILPELIRQVAGGGRSMAELRAWLRARGIKITRSPLWRFAHSVRQTYDDSVLEIAARILAAGGSE